MFSLTSSAFLELVKTRQTLKVIAEKPLPAKAFCTSTVEQLIEAAYWAPFHYQCDKAHQQTLASVLPFRFYVLSSESCRKLAQALIDQQMNMGKTRGLLFAADYLILATWLPHCEETPADFLPADFLPSDLSSTAVPATGNINTCFAGSLLNMEHLAAAGAAIQNLLLAATELGLYNYWGSGAVLREPTVFSWLNIPDSEILLGSIFLASPDTSADKFPSKQRHVRGELSGLYRVVDF